MWTDKSVGSLSLLCLHPGQPWVAVKQWCGCWGSHIYSPYSALQQLHRHKERHHYPNRGPLIGPRRGGAVGSVWEEGRAAGRWGTGGGVARRGEGLGRRTRCGQSVGDGRSKTAEGVKMSLCTVRCAFLSVLNESAWMNRWIACQLDGTQQIFRWRAQTFPLRARTETLWRAGGQKTNIHCI